MRSSWSCGNMFNTTVSRVWPQKCGEKQTGRSRPEARLPKDHANTKTSKDDRKVKGLDHAPWSTFKGASSDAATCRQLPSRQQSVRSAPLVCDDPSNRRLSYN